MSVAVVTDSTACLPADLRDPKTMTVVGVPVTLNGVSGDEGIDITTADVIAAFKGRRVDVSTSRPAPETLTQQYRDLLDAGHDGIVSVHLSSKLSGTVDSAKIAAEIAPDRIRVVDSRQVGMGLGFCATAALNAAVAGQDLDDVAAAAETAVARTHTYFYVDTLEFLRRGGRISAAGALLGTALAVKPILRIDDGTIVVREKVRTSTRAHARLRDFILESAEDSPIDIALHYLDTPDTAHDLAEWLTSALGDRVKRVVITEIGAVLAAHCGPGLLGAVVHQRQQST